MKREQAELLAIQALSWMASDDEIFHGFLGATGADASDLRERAADPHFLGAVLDYLMQQDDWVIGFARAANIPPQQVMEIRQSLPGGEQWHWT